MKRLLPASLLFTIGLTLGVSVGAEPDPSILGRIGDRAITLEDYELFVRLKRVESEERGIPIPPHEELVPIFAVHWVLSASVEPPEEMNPPQDPVGWELWEMKVREAYTRIMEEEMFVKGPIPEKDLRDYYEENRELFAQSPYFSFRNIFLDSTRASGESSLRALGERAKRAAEDLQAVQDEKGIVPLDAFLRVASETMGASTGDIEVRGPFQVGQINSTLESAAVGLEAGGISEVVETKNGFYILRLEEKNLDRYRSFEEVASEIENRLKFRIQKERYATIRQPFLDPKKYAVHEAGLAALVDWATDSSTVRNVPLAESGDFKIGLMDYIEYLRYATAPSAPSSEQSPEEIEAIHSRALIHHLLYPMIALEHAVSRGYTEDATFRNRVRVGQMAVLGKHEFLNAVKQGLENLSPIPESEARTYYDSHKEQYVTETVYWFKELALRPRDATSAFDREFAYREVEKEALDLLERMRNGESEGETIMKFSEGEEADEGGMTPPLTQGRRYSPEVWEAVENLEVGEWTERPLRERGMAILLKLESAIPSEQQSFETVEGQVVGELNRVRALQITDRLIDQILESHDVEIDVEAVESLKARMETGALASSNSENLGG